MNITQTCSTCHADFYIHPNGSDPINCVELPSELSLTEALFRKLEQQVVLSFNEPVNLLNLESFVITVKQGQTVKVLVPKSIKLDGSKTKVIFEFEFTSGMDNAVIKVAN